MRISMNILCDELGDHVVFKNIDGRGDELRLEGALPYRAQASVRNDHVYLLSPNEPDDAWKNSDACLVICGATSKPQFSGLYLALSPSLSEMEALCFLLEIFEKYSRWYERMQKELAVSPDLNRLCRIGYDLLRNPITLFDPAHALIAAFGEHTEAFRDILEVKGASGFVLTDQAYKALITRPEHEDNDAPGATAVTESPFEPGRVMFSDILCAGEEYRLCVNEILHPFRPGDYQLCQILAGILETALQNAQTRENQAKNELSELLHGYLTGDLPSVENRDRILGMMGWKQDDAYICLCLENGKSEQGFIANDRYICTRLEELLPDASSFMLEGRIACVRRLGGTGKADDSPERLDQFLQGSFFHLGVSRIFTGLDHAAEAFLQAQIAIRAGKHLPDGVGIYRFADHSLPELLRSGLSGLPPHSYCLPELLSLLAEEDKRVNYAETLRVYVENERNLLKSAEVLHIHRTTLFYRLGHIREALKLDLDDPQIRFELLLSFRLLDLERQ